MEENTINVVNTNVNVNPNANAVTVNADQTLGIPKELFGAASGVKDIATYFAFREANFRFVDVHVGGFYGIFNQQINPIFSMMDEDDEEAEKKFKSVVGPAKLHIVPNEVLSADGKNLEERIKYLANAYRNRLQKGMDAEGKLTLAQCEENLKNAAEIREEFGDIMNYVERNKDQWLADFEVNVNEIVSKLNVVQRRKDQIIAEMVQSAKDGLSTKNWYMNVRVMLPSERMKEDIKAMIFAPVIEIANVIAKALKSYKVNKLINTRTVNHLASMTQDLEINNKADNPFVKYLIEDLKDLVHGNDDYKVEVLTDALTDIYGYAQEIGYNIDQIDSPFSPEQMAVMIQNRTRQMSLDELTETAQAM
jgi:hypothetical protein